MSHYKWVTLYYPCESLYSNQGSTEGRSFLTFGLWFRRRLLNMVLFQFWWTWQFPGDATPNFICDSNFPIFRLSIDVSFIPVSYLQHGQNRQNLKLVTQGTEGFFTPDSFHSTSLATWGSSWASTEAKFIKEFEFLSFSRCFSARIEKSSKTSKI